MGKIMGLFWSDTETSGLDEEECEIVELAYVTMDAQSMVSLGNSVVDAYRTQFVHHYIKPTKPVPPEVAAINGYSEEKWEQNGAVPFEDAVPGLFKAMEGRTPAGQNPSFDMRFYTAECKRRDLAMPPMDYHLIDVAMLAWPMRLMGLIPGVSLRYTVPYFNLGDQKHGALSDVIHAIEVYQHIMQANLKAVEFIIGQRTEIENKQLKTVLARATQALQAAGALGNEKAAEAMQDILRDARNTLTMCSGV